MGSCSSLHSPTVTRPKLGQFFLWLQGTECLGQNSWGHKRHEARTKTEASPIELDGRFMSGRPMSAGDSSGAARMTKTGLRTEGLTKLSVGGSDPGDDACWAQRSPPHGAVRWINGPRQFAAASSFPGPVQPCRAQTRAGGAVDVPWMDGDQHHVGGVSPQAAAAYS